MSFRFIQLCHGDLQLDLLKPISCGFMLFAVGSPNLRVHQSPKLECQADSITLNAAMDACGRAGEWQCALGIFDDFERLELKLTAVSCTSLVSACENAKRWQHPGSRSKPMSNKKGVQRTKVARSKQRGTKMYPINLRNKTLKHVKHTTYSCWSMKYLHRLRLVLGLLAYQQLCSHSC